MRTVIGAGRNEEKFGKRSCDIWNKFVWEQPHEKKALKKIAGKQEDIKTIDIWKTILLADRIIRTMW